MKDLKILWMLLAGMVGPILLLLTQSGQLHKLGAVILLLWSILSIFLVIVQFIRDWSNDHKPN